MKTEVKEPPSPPDPPNPASQVLLTQTGLLTESLRTEEGSEGLTAMEAQGSESGGAVPTHPSLPCRVPGQRSGSVK